MTIKVMFIAVAISDDGAAPSYHFVEEPRDVCDIVIGNQEYEDALARFPRFNGPQWIARHFDALSGPVIEAVR